MTSELLPCPFCWPEPHMTECHQDDYGYWKVSCGRCGCHSGIRPKSDPDARSKVITHWNTRAVPDVPELVRYDLACDFDGKYAAHIVEVELGEYVLYSQAAAIIAAKDAEITKISIFNDAYWKQLIEHKDRAEAAEAKLAQIKDQKPVAWMHPEAGWTDASKAEVSAQCKPSTYPKPLYAAPVDQTAEIESITSYAKQIIAAFDEDNDLDNPEKFNAYHNLKSALSGKEPL